MQTFTKAERLSGTTTIDKLYKKGKSISSFPFKISFLEVAHSDVPVKILISVPKRLYKKAVDRNKIKRLIREVYRKNKMALYGELNNRKVYIMFVYTSKTETCYKDLEKQMITAMQKICKTINP